MDTTNWSLEAAEVRKIVEEARKRNPFQMTIEEAAELRLPKLRNGAEGITDRSLLTEEELKRFESLQRSIESGNVTYSDVTLASIAF